MQRRIGVGMGRDPSLRPPSRRCNTINSVVFPYIEWHTFHLGPLTLQVWGMFVALGFLIGAAVSARQARRKGIDPALIWDLTGWVMIGAFLFARVSHVFFYEPSFYLTHPAEILAIWNGGFSSIGGFVGATLFGLWFLRRRKVNILSVVDAAVFGLPLGYGIGRIGCALIHDHPGRPTSFFLGERYPDGVVRHDHGFYLSLLGFFLFLLFLILKRRNPPEGMYPAVFLIGYGVARFFLDFLRATTGPIVDTRYFFLTPAQYFSLGMVVVGVWILVKIFKISNESKIETFDPKTGASFLIEGIKYHYGNFEKFSQELEKKVNNSDLFVFENQDIINKMKHEAVAYINRIGQFYYFAKGETVKNKLGDPKKTIPTISSFIGFRHKYSAHRAVDKSEGENPIFMNQLNRSFSTQAVFMNGRLIFQIIANPNFKKNRTFDILVENKKIVREAESLISLL
ncbi:MAG TPA: prolipoprotein diacylglyceryl transferase [Patescibacteria group bacterium]|nr:prolipoprotein diacylglyceryl transferase [Patescibacteria group bacterium]